MNLSGVIQFLLGFSLGIVMLAGAGAGAAYYIFTRLAEVPPRPEFAQPSEEEATETVNAEVEATPETESETTPVANVVEEEPPTPTLEERLGPNAYKARVTWPQGLSLRDRPALDSTRVGGIAYNQEVYVLEDSQDGNWQKIHIPVSGQEAWVKAGNVDRVE